MSDDSPSTGGGYDVPDLSTIDSPEDAESAINKFNAQWLADRQHPYADANHPQRADFQKAINELYRIRFADADDRDPVQRAMAEGLAEREQAQEERTQRAEAAFEALAGDDDLDLDPPGDLVETEVQALEIGALAAKGQWDEVIDEVRGLIEQCTRLPDAVRQRFALMKHIPDTAMEQKLMDLDQVLHAICCEGRRKMGLPPRSLGNSEQQAADGHGMLDVDEAEVRIAELRATPGYMQLNSDMSASHRQAITDELLSLYQRIEDLKQGD